jgi:NADH-quinone oxidoreductase subunit M
MAGSIILTSVLALPFIGAIAVAFVSAENKKLIKTIGLVFATATFLLSLWLFLEFEGSSAEMQFVEKYTWISESTGSRCSSSC